MHSGRGVTTDPTRVPFLGWAHADRRALGSFTINTKSHYLKSNSCLAHVCVDDIEGTKAWLCLFLVSHIEILSLFGIGIKINRKIYSQLCSHSFSAHSRLMQSSKSLLTRSVLYWHELKPTICFC